MQTSQVVVSGIFIVALAVLLGFSANACREYNLKSLEVQKACLEAGRTPLECGVVRVH